MEKEKTTGKPVITRAKKKDNAKGIIKELLRQTPKKSNDLIDEAAKLYTEKFGGEDTENVNDVKGRIGSVLDVMKKENEVQFEGGTYALTELKTAAETEVKPKKATKTKRTTKKKSEEVVAAEVVAPVEEKTEEVSEPTTEEKPKKRGRKPKAAAKPTIEEKVEEKAEEKTEEVVQPPVVEEKPKAEERVREQPQVQAQEQVQEQPQTLAKPVMDMSFLFGEVKTNKKPESKKEEPKREEPKKEEPKKEERKREEKRVQAEQPVKAEKAEKTERKNEQKPTAKKPTAQRSKSKTATKPQTADEKLQEAFLKRLRALGGDYFEYYSVYLLEKYSRKNGRRLEGLKISGGDRDGGIDGELELTDTLGFRETIYIQAKNWDPDKGDERLWTVGETLVQQFIGACVYRQAKEGKQRCRGVFVTTSRFTAEAKRMLEDTSDSFIGYDGADLYETAKECSFGLVQKNGEWALDEELLSGERALFHIL